MGAVQVGDANVRALYQGTVAHLQDACKIEHDISDETFEKLKEHIEKAVKS